MVISAITIAIAAGYLLAAKVYIEFISRDPYDFDKEPNIASKIIFIATISIPFILLFISKSNFHSLLSPLTALAISAVISPAIFANRTGPGLTFFKNAIEKSALTSLFALIICLISSLTHYAWWYGLCVATGYLSITSRTSLLLLSVQDEIKSEDWNKMRVKALLKFAKIAKISFLMISLFLLIPLQQSEITKENWNKGLKSLVDVIRSKGKE